MNDAAVIDVVRKTVTVDCAVEEAFRIFTAEATSWWPVDRHSIHGEKVQEVVFEPNVGGEIYEVAESGERGHWATVLDGRTKSDDSSMVRTPCSGRSRNTPRYAAFPTKATTGGSTVRAMRSSRSRAPAKSAPGDRRSRASQPCVSSRRGSGCGSDAPTRM